MSLLVLWLSLMTLPVLRAYRPPVTALWAISMSTFTASSCGALLALALKCLSSTISLTATEGWRIWARPTLWFAVIGICLCGPGQLYLLELALASGRTSQVVPLYQSLLIILTISAGGIFYHEVRLF